MGTGSVEAVKRLGALLVGIMLLSSVAFALVSAPRSDGNPPPSLRPSVPAASAAPSPSPQAAAPGPVPYGPPQSPSPVVNAAQSRLWWNDGTWWAVLLDEATLTHRIFALDASASTWNDTGVVVDDRRFARLDVLWDGSALVVASAGPDPEPRHALQITRFSYDATGRRYLRDPNFPVPITATGVEAVTVTRDVTGRLWVAYQQSGELALDHSLDSDLAWRGPFVPTAAEGPIEGAAIAAVGGRVALVWVRPGEDALHVATHRVDGPEDTWEEQPAASVSHLASAEGDQLSLAVHNAPGAERLYVAVATGVAEADTRGRLDPQVVLVEFALDAPPTVYLVGRRDDQHVDPIVLVDAAAREVYVVAASPRGGGSVYYKSASLDQIVFPPGIGTPLISASDTQPNLAHPTSTKQSLDATTGLVVAATDSGAGVYAFGSLGLRSSTAAPTPGASLSEATVLFEQTFDGLSVGGPVPGWELEGEPPPSMVVTTLQGVDSSARLSSTSTTDARACAAYAVESAGVLTLEAEILYNLATGDDLRLLQARGSGGELASLRLRDDELVYFDGAVRVRSGVTVEPGRWLRATLRFDLAAGTYDLGVVDVAAGQQILAATDLDARSTAAIPNRVCAELPPQPGLDLYLDDVRVVAEP